MELRAVGASEEDSMIAVTMMVLPFGMAVALSIVALRQAATPSRAVHRF
jgi:hypothetical protein